MQPHSLNSEETGQTEVNIIMVVVCMARNRETKCSLKTCKTKVKIMFFMEFQRK